MRSPAEMDIILIEATNRCFLNCSNCSRAVAHQTKTREMDPDTFRNALRSLEGWYKPGRIIGMMGGEPTLNKHFHELCRVFRDAMPPTIPPLGRKPIKDFDAYVHQRLYDRSGGRGLWTSFGPKWQDVAEDVHDTFAHWSANSHEHPSTHQAMLVSREEYCKATGMPDEEWVRNRDACVFQNMWSATIAPNGCYPCEMMATIDNLYFNGEHAWPIEKDWWKRKPSEFGNMLDLCNHCALAQPGPAQADYLERDIISKDQVQKLIQIGSPAVKQGRYDAYEAGMESRLVATKDNYLPSSGIRVKNDNPHVYGKRVALVTVCVGRAEHLRRTLPHNAKLVDETIVVTTLTEDGGPLIDNTSYVVSKSRAENVSRVWSDRCYDNSDAFNLGKMQNDGIKALTDPDWIILATCDVFLNEKLPEFLKTHVLNPGVLYGTHRYDLSESGSKMPAHSTNAEPNGYFAMFNRRASALAGRYPAVISEAFCSAGGVDSHFMQQFAVDKRVVIPELAVTHIEHAAKMGDGWNGRMAASEPRWRQVAMITSQGTHWFCDPPKGKVNLRLTDTRYARQAECDSEPGKALPMDIVKIVEREIWFLGKNLGTHHIHVAAFI